MVYSDKVIDHYNNPRNVGSLDKDADDVGTGVVGAPAEDEALRRRARLMLEEDSRRVKAASHHPCPSAPRTMASAPMRRS